MVKDQKYADTGLHRVVPQRIPNILQDFTCCHVNITLDNLSSDHKHLYLTVFISGIYAPVQLFTIFQVIASLDTFIWLVWPC